jgi:hypothetical protein
VPHEELSRCSGLYLDAQTRWLTRVSLENGRLMIGWPPAAEELIPLAPDLFRLDKSDVEAVFVATPGGDAHCEVIGSTRFIHDGFVRLEAADLG